MKYLILLLISVQGFCQEKFSDIYYPHIDKAELAITNENYKEALQNYESAFVKVKYPLALDLYNAAVCKIRLNDFDGAKPFLLKLATKGLPISVLEEETVFKNLGSKWTQFKPVYLQIQSTFISSIPEEIKKIIRDLEELGDAYAKELKQKVTKVAYDKLRGYQIVRKDLQSIDELSDSEKLLKEFIELKTRLIQAMDSTGGFSENEIGISDKNLLYPGVNDNIADVKFIPLQAMHWDDTKKEVYILNLPVKQSFESENYFKSGIEAGKWHRQSLKKNNLTANRFAIAEFILEEPCSSVEQGYYIRQNLETDEKPTYSFLENEELKLAKAIYDLKGNTDFKISSSKTIERLFFASCQSAEAELKKWEKLNIR